MKTLLSLFDYSGNWSRPVQEAGWNVVLWDIKHDPDYVTKFKDINEANAEFIYEHIFDNYGTVDGILSANPCTDFASSGARWWPEKDASGQTELSIELVKQTLRIVDLCMPNFWVVENPIGRIHNLVPELGKALMYFNPCEFGEPYHKKDSFVRRFQY